MIVLFYTVYPDRYCGLCRVFGLPLNLTLSLPKMNLTKSRKLQNPDLPDKTQKCDMKYLVFFNHSALIWSSSYTHHMKSIDEYILTVLMVLPLKSLAFFFNLLEQKNMAVKKLNDQSPRRYNCLRLPVHVFCNKKWKIPVYSSLITQVNCCKFSLNYSPNFKEALEIVYLSKGHTNKNKRLEERPPHHAAVCVVID